MGKKTLLVMIAVMIGIIWGIVILVTHDKGPQGAAEEELSHIVS